MKPILWAMSAAVVLTLAAMASEPSTKNASPATPVSFTAKTHKEAIAQLQNAQMGGSPFDEGKTYVVDLSQEDPVAVNVEFAKTPFWKACDELAAKAKLRTIPYWKTAGKNAPHAAVGFRADDGKSGPVDYCGPFRVEAAKVTASEDKASLNVLLRIAVEPRYDPILFKLKSDSIRIQNAKGALEPVNQGGTGDVRMLGKQPTELNVRVPWTADTKALVSLEGEVTVLLPPAFAVFEFPTLDGKPEVKKTDGVIARAEVIDRDLKKWTVRVRLTYPKPTADGGFDLESHQTWVMEHNRLRLQSAKGNRTLEPKGDPVITVAEGQSVYIDYRFEDVEGQPSDWKALYTAPANPVKIPLKFKFENLSP